MALSKAQNQALQQIIKTVLQARERFLAIQKEDWTACAKIDGLNWGSFSEAKREWHIDFWKRYVNIDEAWGNGEGTFVIGINKRTLLKLEQLGFVRDIHSVGTDEKVGVNLQMCGIPENWK